MVFFFFLLIIAVTIGVATWNSRRTAVNNALADAARRLGLRCADASSPTQTPWIFGERHGIRIEVKPFIHSKEGHRARWTGYRLSFDEAIDLSISGEHDPRRQALALLSVRFATCEVDSQEIFCARSSPADDSARLVSDVEYLIKAARELRHPDNGSRPAVPSPPPLPEKAEEPTVSVAVEAAAEPEEPAMGAAPIDDEDEICEPAPENVPPTTSPPTEATEAEAPMNEAARRLFAEGLNHFEIGQRFIAEYRGRTLEGSGVLRLVERFRNDRHLGRGPGLAAEVEIFSLEEARGGLRRVVAVIPMTEADLDLAKWKELTGETVAICGTPDRCDAFVGRIYCADGLVEV